MIPIRRLEQTIPDLTWITILIIATSVFGLSFFNLQAAAREARYQPVVILVMSGAMRP
jgi:hypothetical protein